MIGKTLITGGTGFVGKNLTDVLKGEGVELSFLNRERLNDTRIILPECENVIHLAGKAHDLKNSLNPSDYYRINFEITKNLYDSFLNSQAKKFIFVSSVKAVADSVDFIMTEDIEPHPQTDYGKSKLMAEEYIQQQKLPDGKSYYILRPCMIHGPGNRGNLNLLFSFLQKGIPYPLAAFENRRSFLSIDNLCFIIKELLEQNVFSGIYQASDDDALSTNEVIAILGEGSNCKVRLLRFPTKLVKLIAAFGDLLSLPLNSERLGKLTENYVISNQKIKVALNKELPFTSRNGLLKTAMFLSSI